AGRTPAGRISARRAAALRILPPARWGVAVRSVLASRHRGSAERAIGLPRRRPMGVPLHAWATPVVGCLATAPSPTWRCNRNSRRRDSRAGSLVRPGPGGSAGSYSDGSDRCSGLTPITICSITFTVWPYAYDDVYYGIYGPYAYYDPGVNSRGVSSGRYGGGSRRHAGAPNSPPPRAPGGCRHQTPEATDWPAQRPSAGGDPADEPRPAP